MEKWAGTWGGKKAEGELSPIPFEQDSRREAATSGCWLLLIPTLDAAVLEIISNPPEVSVLTQKSKLLDENI